MELTAQTSRLSSSALHARGALAAATLAVSMTLIHRAGPAAHPGLSRAAAFLVRPLAVTTLLLVGSSLSLNTPGGRAWIGRAIARLQTAYGRSPRGHREWCVVAGICLLTVAAFDWRGIIHGFFRLDDFEFLFVARREGFFHQLTMPHGGHFLPLYRAVVFILTRLFGPSALPFNLTTSFSCVALLYSGCWLLGELRVGWFALGTFVLLAWFWPGWSEFTAGYYCCVSYIMSLACGLAALAAMLQATRNCSKRWLLGSLIGAAACLGFGSVGAWIIPALVAIALATPADDSPLIRGFARRAAAAVAVLTVLYLSLLAVVFRSGGFIGLPAEPNGGAAETLAAIAGGFGGLLLNLLTPVQFSMLQTGRLIYGLQAGAFGLLAWSIGKLWSHSTPADRRLIIVLLGVVVVQLAMIVIARRPGTTGFYWPPKWTAIAHVTLVLLVALLVDRHLRLRGPAGPESATLPLNLFALALGVVACTPAFLNAMEVPISRENLVRRAQAREEATGQFRADLELLVLKLDQRPVVLPRCSPSALFAVLPAFEFYPLEFAVAALPPGLARVGDATGAFDPRFQTAISTIPNLKRLYAHQ